MTRPGDVSSRHFDWLVEGRSRNQRSTAALYAIIESHSLLMMEKVAYQRLAQDLAAVAFSLWRAVFLSDLTGDLGDQLADVTVFLSNLIAHNTVLYQTDYNSREWAFTYYLTNAQHRLSLIAAWQPRSAAAQISGGTRTAKEEWSDAQSALDLAIANFAEALAAHDPA